MTGFLVTTAGSAFRRPGRALPEVAVLIGTRPEAIKVAPLVAALREQGRVTPWVIDTGQHPGRVSEALAPFGIGPDATLALHRPTGSLAELSAALTTAVDAVLTERRPAAVVVHGDTMTTLVGGLVAFWHRVPVIHLEAGLRTYDLDRPFPEEANRAMVARFASLHLAPTEAARSQLVDEHVPADRIVVTGNTVVDALRYLVDSGRAVAPEWIERDRPLLVATMHRRENWGAGVAGMVTALTALERTRPDLRTVVVTHPNPELSGEIRQRLDGVAGIRIVPTLPYDEMLGLVNAADLIVTDSGGLQEEAATLGIPVLVTRDATERPEALIPGYGELVGTDPARIVAGATALLRVPRARHCQSPFGDGRAGQRAAVAIAELVGAEAPDAVSAQSRVGSAL